MPRYFFHVLDGRAYIDKEGTDLKSVDEAEQQAVVAAGEIIRDGNFTGEEWSMSIVDEAGNIVRTLRFSSGGSSQH